MECLRDAIHHYHYYYHLLLEAILSCLADVLSPNCVFAVPCLKKNTVREGLYSKTGSLPKRRRYATIASH